MIPNKKQLLKLGLISVAAISIGALVGLVLNYGTLKERRSGGEVSTPPSPIEEEEQEKIATYSGTIKPSAPSIYMEGTHYLEGADGGVIVLLESPKIDLGLIEGWEVEVEGTVKKTVEGDQTIMEVAEVRL